MKTHKRGSGFTLIELMIVVAIIAILTTIAIMSYIRYSGRAQVVEGLLAGDVGKTHAQVEFRLNRTWPDALSDLYSTSTSRYVANVEGISDGPDHYRVTVTMSDQTVIPIQNRQFSLWTVDGGSIWNCGPSPGGTPLSPLYLPANCQSTHP